MKANEQKLVWKTCTMKASSSSLSFIWRKKNAILPHVQPTVPVLVIIEWAGFAASCTCSPGLWCGCQRLPNITMSWSSEKGCVLAVPSCHIEVSHFVRLLFSESSIPQWPACFSAGPVIMWSNPSWGEGCFFFNWYGVTVHPSQAIHPSLA